MRKKEYRIVNLLNVISKQIQLSILPSNGQEIFGKTKQITYMHEMLCFHCGVYKEAGHMSFLQYDALKACIKE